MTALLAMQDVVKHFPVKGSGRMVHAVNGVSLDLLRGETLGITVLATWANLVAARHGIPGRFGPLDRGLGHGYFPFFGNVART